MAIQNVYFKQGTKEEYDLLTVKDNNTLYFLNDTQELYKGELRIAAGKTATTVYDGLMSLEDKNSLDKAVRDIIAIVEAVENDERQITTIITETIPELEGQLITYINNKLNYNMVKDIYIDIENDTVTLNKTIKNLNTGNEQETSNRIPIATTDHAGMMSAEQVARLDAVEGRTIRLLYSAKQNPTALEIQSFVEDSGYTDSSLWSSIAVVVDQIYHIWHWYANDSLWKDDGVDTVTKFTNSSPGTILGSNEDGKVKAESDGAGSVNGWGNKLNKNNPKFTGTLNSIYSIEDEEEYDNEYSLSLNSYPDGITLNRRQFLKDEETGEEHDLNKSQVEISDYRISMDSDGEGGVQHCTIDPSSFSMSSSESDGRTSIDADGVHVWTRNGTIDTALTINGFAIRDEYGGTIEKSELDRNYLTISNTTLEDLPISKITLDLYDYDEGISRLHPTINVTDLDNLSDESNYTLNSTYISPELIEIVSTTYEDGEVLSSNGVSLTKDGLRINGVDPKMDKVNPTGTGALSINRKASTDVGENSVALGKNNIASGGQSIALGTNNISVGNSSIALGQGNKINKINDKADGAVTIGLGLESYGIGQIVLGKYNIPLNTSHGSSSYPKYPLIFGWGTSGNKKNILTMDDNGNLEVAGTVKSNNKELATKEYVDNKPIVFMVGSRVMMCPQGSTWNDVINHYNIAVDIPTGQKKEDEHHHYYVEIDKMYKVRYLNSFNNIVFAYDTFTWYNGDHMFNELYKFRVGYYTDVDGEEIWYDVKTTDEVIDYKSYGLQADD